MRPPQKVALDFSYVRCKDQLKDQHNQNLYFKFFFTDNDIITTLCLVHIQLCWLTLDLKNQIWRSYIELTMTSLSFLLAAYFGAYWRGCRTPATFKTENFVTIANTFHKKKLWNLLRKKKNIAADKFPQTNTA